MRVDQLLCKLCLVRTRSIAKKACDKNLVKINNKPAKASAAVAAGDIIEFSLAGYCNWVKIREVPRGNVAKAAAPQFYEILKRDRLTPAT